MFVYLKMSSFCFHSYSSTGYKFWGHNYCLQHLKYMTPLSSGVSYCWREISWQFEGDFSVDVLPLAFRIVFNIFKVIVPALCFFCTLSEFNNLLWIVLSFFTFGKLTFISVQILFLYHFSYSLILETQIKYFSAAFPCPLEIDFVLWIPQYNYLIH